MDEKCKRQFLFLIFAINCCHVPALSYDDGVDMNHFDYPGIDPQAASDLQKRLSKFVRIGRGLSSFIRIGRNNLNGPSALYQLDDLPDDELTESNDGAFYDFDPTNYESQENPVGPFVRLGRNYDDGVAENDMESGGVEKRGGAFIRMGKFPTSAFLHSRTGRVSQIPPTKYYRRTGRIGHSSFIRIGKRDTTDAMRRLETENDKQSDSGLERQHKYRDEQETNETGDNEESRRWLKIGRDVDSKYDDDSSDLIHKTEANVDDTKDILEHGLNDGQRSVDKRYSSFVRIGKRDEDMVTSDENNGVFEMEPIHLLNSGGSTNSPNKRYSSFVRIGRDAEKRRFSSFVRIGKSPLHPYHPYDSDIDKRLSSFVRIGKGFNPYKDDVDKRYSSFVRIGKRFNPQDTDFSKRYSSFVRIGKSTGGDMNNDLNKRYSSFVRIGKDNNYENEDLQKRLSSFIRVGKDDQEDDDDNGFNKRYSSFVRIGKNIPDPYKRYSSFVRIGKNVGDQAEKRLSSFIRVGKNNLSDNLSDGDIAADSEIPAYFSGEQGHVLEKRESKNEEKASELKSNHLESETS